MAWTYLLLAGLFEIGFALGLKHTDGFTRLWPSLGTAAAAAASLYLMTLAMRTIRWAPPTRCGPGSVR